MILRRRCTFQYNGNDSIYVSNTDFTITVDVYTLATSVAKNIVDDRVYISNIDFTIIVNIATCVIGNNIQRH